MSGGPREQWGTKLGFVLAAVGSAVGLGNMWRFSYLTAENGGAAFVLLYLLMTALIGLPVMLAELVIGRGARKSPIQALAHYGGGAWRALGALFVVAGFVILSYYSVIAGWTLRYAVAALVEGFGADPAATFQNVASGANAIGWHLLFMALTIFIVAGGVKRGIERTALVLMPVLFLIVAGLAVYAAFLDGAGPGYAYYFQTSFAEVLSFRVLRDAAGQAFFSLSLGMGAMLTYASYLSRENHLPNESLVIAGADFGVAFVAGLMIFPLIFALGLQAEVGESTVGALFITIPHTFAEMGAVGRLLGVLFFVALAVGAFTSAISLLEVVVASAADGLGWPRRKAAEVFGATVALLGVLPAVNTDVLDLMDKFAGNVFLVGGAFFLSLFVGWVMEDPIAEVRVGAPGVRWFFLWRSLLRFAVPVVLGVVLLYSIRDAFGALAGLLGLTG